jgi:2,4-dienoyl-CoA reductase-like NADH-dependent reductase (Old Yellow Enzyme family)
MSLLFSNASLGPLFSPAQVIGWKTVVSAVHARGGRIFVQLMHCGLPAACSRTRCPRR